MCDLVGRRTLYMSGRASTSSREYVGISSGKNAGLLFWLRLRWVKSGQHEEIGPTYKLLRREISALRPRRVSAADRIERAWPGVWERWLQKFDSDDHQFVREECARRILKEMEPEP